MSVATWNPANEKPGHANIYRTRMVIPAARQGGEDETVVEGYSYWDHLRQRWSAQAFTIKAVDRLTSAPRFHAQQIKEWAPV